MENILCNDGTHWSGCRHKTNEDTECDDKHVNYSYISDTSTCTSLIQDGNMVHNSAPKDISSNLELENVIIRRKKKWNPKIVMKTRSVYSLLMFTRKWQNKIYVDSR